MNISKNRKVLVFTSIAIWILVASIFFFLQPNSKFLIALFCLLIALGFGFTLWIFVPLRFSLYLAGLVLYVLFLVTEHILQIDLLLYGLAIILLTEVFIGRRMSVLQ